MLIGWKAAIHDPKIASFRYRVAEPVAALAARGHDVELFSSDRIDRYDLVVFSKTYRAAEQELARSVRARGGRVVLDLCDNHFYNPYDLPRYRRARADLLAMISLADRLIVSTPTLGRIVRDEAGLVVDPFVVGDAAERISLPPRAPGDGRMLLWFGSHGSPNAPSGMDDLLAIAGHLRAQHARTPFRLVVASNDEAKFARLAPLLGIPSRYVAWTQEGFPALLAQAEGVLLPLSQNPFVAAKTHNRITTALWPGVPVVADQIESYREFAPFAWLGNWGEGLRALLEDGAAALARAAGARDYIDRHWTMEQLAPLWEDALGLPVARNVFLRREQVPVGPERRTETQPVAPFRENRNLEPARASLYQGALDTPEAHRLTGWARLISEPARGVRVTLESEGAVIVEAQACLPRPDLATAGFRHHDCGFALEVPREWRDGRPRRFAVVADGARTIESTEARFGNNDAPGQEPAFAALSQQSGAPGQVPAHAADARRAREGLRLQARLADELEGLNEAVEQVRRIAARIVLAAGEGGNASDR